MNMYIYTPSLACAIACPLISLVGIVGAIYSYPYGRTVSLLVFSCGGFLAFLSLFVYGRELHFIAEDREVRIFTALFRYFQLGSHITHSFSDIESLDLAYDAEGAGLIRLRFKDGSKYYLQTLGTRRFYQRLTELIGKR